MQLRAGQKTSWGPDAAVPSEVHTAAARCRISMSKDIRWLLMAALLIPHLACPF